MSDLLIQLTAALAGISVGYVAAALWRLRRRCAPPALINPPPPPPPPPPVEPVIDAIRAHQLSPGDLVVVHLPAPCTEEARQRMAAAFKDRLPAGVQVAVAWGVDRIEILKAYPAAP